MNLTVVIHLATRCLCQGYIWPKVSLTWSLPKCQPYLMPDCGRVHLTNGQPDPKSTQMSTCPKAWSWGYICLKVSLTLTEVCPNVNLTQSLILGGTSDQMSVWPKVYQNVNLTQSLILGVHLTKCQPDPKSAKMSPWPKAWLLGGCLTKS